MKNLPKMKSTETKDIIRRIDSNHMPEANNELDAINIKFKKAKAKEAKAKLVKAKLKNSADEENAEGFYGTKVEPRKSLNSFLRNQNKYLINSIAIFDRKAALMIRICTAIISGLIAFHEYIEAHVLNGYLLSTILSIGLLISLVLSILSTKPHLHLVRNVLKKTI